MKYPQNFNTGDTVKHVAGDGTTGPAMTVDHAGQDTTAPHYLCGWWTTDGDYQTRWFRETELAAA